MKKCSCNHWMGECDKCGGPACPACHDRGFRTECPGCWNGSPATRSRVQVKSRGINGFAWFVVALSTHMMRELGYELKSVSISKLNGGRHEFIHAMKIHKLFYGEEFIDWVAGNSMSGITPKSYSYLWSDQAGKRAVYELVVHEVAHAIQSEKDGRHYGSAHNAVWAEAVYELFDRFPYNEVEHLGDD